ncbi:cysteine desulfurase family protein [Paenibacillus sp. GCM10012307]|uniref:cysteine desulfurase n=1 Tax=Paenibacillus roseus TaxID=2798579 RepID=A0A934J994_9BACL|nr:cysteine desulfurase family protein [Paenibacillus roseus]MBJ6362991.1 cysteine desulfurase [Paenibacillus roseus]
MPNIYFDHASTTPLHPEVLSVMMDIYQGPPGNPSSTHSFGRTAKRHLTQARDRIAAVVGCHPSELMFTSGGTESDNTALRGTLNALRHTGKRHLITSSAEHHAVLHTSKRLEEEGYSITLLEPDGDGIISPEKVQNALREDTTMISLLYVNNEVGTIQPIAEIGAVAREAGVLFHVDGVQALGSIRLNLHELPVDLMSFTAHKINGPQGIGALYIAKSVPFQPQIVGGSQEGKRRAGTENTASATGFAKAVELSDEHFEEKNRHISLLRETFIHGLEAELGSSAFVINGHKERSVPHILNISLLGADTETLLMNLDMEGIAASSGSACTSGSLERSHVLKAMSLPPDRLNSAVRFSFGLGNTLKEIEYAVKKIATILNRIRSKV